MNRPSVTLSAIVIALALGATRLPFLQDLRPLGDFYIAILKICVLPFLLATMLPLAVRSAMASGSAEGTMRSLLVWLLITLVAVGITSALVTGAIFHFAAVDDRMMANIGALVGQAVDNVDVEFAIDRRGTRRQANITKC